MFQGFLPGMFGISHGAIQFVCYEELKTKYNNFKERPIDYRLVGILCDFFPSYLFIKIKKLFHDTLRYTCIFVYVGNHI